MSRRERTPEPARNDAPVVAVSMGDPGGVGPEVICRALGPGGPREDWPSARFIVHGSSAALHAAAEALAIEPYWWRVPRGSDLLASARSHSVVLVDSDDPGSATSFQSEPTRLGGELSFRWVEDAIASTQLDDADPMKAHAIVTGPISKAAWSMAGKTRWPGHTELLAERYKVRRFAMMFEGPSLRVSLATVHLPLMDVRDVLTIGRVYDAIDLGAEGCKHLGIERPRIGVCGLNPHAGEGGLLGDEEKRLIEPAIRLAQQQGIDVTGPFPGDTIFNRAIAENGRGFDLVVAMYHDQGLIPVKLLARDQSVNMTIGLPVARTSPDHGTAYDIAGKGVADPGSTEAAIRAALRVVTRPAPDRTGAGSSSGEPL